MITSITLDALYREAGGELLGVTEVAPAVSGAAIDHRKVKSGDLFVALVGERVDGHDFALHAIAAGAVAVMTTRRLDIDVPQLVVADAVEGLAVLARMARAAFRGTIIGITGSAGKTTAKNMLAAILRKVGETVATAGNQNNELGVPLTLLDVTPTTEFLVLEMGAGKPGDIRYLMDIAKPQISVLLNAAPAHLANYENVDEIAQTKGEILDHLPSDGLAVINGEQQWTEQWRVRAAPTRVITIGFDGGCDYRALEVSYQGFQGASFKMACDAEQFHVKLNVPGKGGVHNALSAIAVAHALGISAATINLGLIQVNPASGRGLIHRGASGARIIDDSYNANPMAVCAAIDALAAESGVRTLVLGAMLELGAESTQLHAMVGAYAREAGIERLFAIGETTCAAAYAFGETAAIFSDRETAIAALEGLTTDDVVLIKGSRGAGLEVVVDALLKRQEEVVC